MAQKKPSRFMPRTAPQQNKPVRSPAFPKNHPINDDKVNTALVKFLLERLDFANEQRKYLVDRFADIDRQLSGFVKLDPDDIKREQDNRRGKDVKPVKTNLELVKTQLSEAVTYFLSVFAPHDGMFEAIASPDKQDIANGFVKKLNTDAEKMGYFRHLAKGFFDMMKYNFGGWTVNWEQLYGTQLGNTAVGTLDVKKNQVVWEGNVISAIDPYNFLYDRAVNPVDLNTKGEFFAIAEVQRKFRLRKMQADGEIFGIERFIDKSSMNLRYFKNKPAIRIEFSGNNVSGDGQTDWVSWLSAGASGETQSGIEIVHYYGWIKPADFNLSDSQELEVWRITIANAEYVVAASKIENSHGMLPVNIAVPVEDGMDLQTRSLAETLIPLQRFASFLLNIHQDAARKALYGLTLFDPSVIPLNEHPYDVAPRVPVNPKGYGKPISEFIYQSFDGPKLDGTMNDLQGSLQMMQHLLPTNIQQMVADLERATEYQAAATVQGASRRLHMFARLIETQAMAKQRHMLMYNILASSTPIEVRDKNGQLQTLNPADMRGADLEYVMAEGLKGIDKIQILMLYKEILQWVVQNREALQEIDVVALLNYVTTLAGDKFDLNQFRVQDIWSQLPPEVKQVLNDGLQQQDGQLMGWIQQHVVALAQQQQNMAAGKPGQRVAQHAPQLPAPSGGTP